MKIGQTSAIYFVSRIIASILGFIATIYFARLLGADPLGVYYLVLGVTSWLAILGSIGVTGAVTKRISEGREREQYAGAGLSFVLGLFVVLFIVLLIVRPYLNEYIGYSATIYVILVLFVTLVWSITSSILTGVKLVHVVGVLSPVKTGGQSILQIGAIMAGFGLTGLFFGYIAGFILVIIVGIYLSFSRLKEIQRPETRHFRSLFDYAKFSWLGSLESKMFNYTDVIVLGFFVSTAFIGIYSVAWNIAMFLILFSGSIRSTLFPEMSERSAEADRQSIVNLLETALSYAGLILIPGLLGGLILDRRILLIYGDEFTQGTSVLGILIVAALVRAYQNQILNTLNAIDRPDLSFRANALFVVTNLSLNIVLVDLIGWVGAAIATVLSMTISLMAAHMYLRSIVDYQIPYAEIGRQCISAVIMGAIVFGGNHIEKSFNVINHNVATVVLLVGTGASVYFLVLLGISPRFRTTIDRNAPIDIPLVNN